MNRKAMSTAITIIITVVIMLAVGLTVFMISSGSITNFGKNTESQSETSFDNLKCMQCCAIKEKAECEDPKIENCKCKSP
jgi:flagellar basal body-associated protein FliL